MMRSKLLESTWDLRRNRIEGGRLSKRRGRDRQ